MAALTLSALTVLASATQSASGNGAAVDLSLLSSLTLEAVRLAVDVSAIAGPDPTLTVYLETSADSASWTSLGSVDVTGTGRVELARAGCLRYVRARWVIGGTGSPSFTFGVSGTAHQVYAVPSDFGALGVGPDQWAGREGEVVLALIAETATAEGYFSGSSRFVPPLVSWGQDLRLAVCKLAAYDVLSAAVGFDAEQANNQNWILRYEQALAWLKDVQAGRATPANIVDSTPTETEVSLIVDSDTARGWNTRRL